MCGIAGYLSRTDQPVARAVVAKMALAVSHRGPDGDGLYVDGKVGLGHRRLAIIDLSLVKLRFHVSMRGKEASGYKKSLREETSCRTDADAVVGELLRVDAPAGGPRPVHRVVERAAAKHTLSGG